MYSRYKRRLDSSGPARRKNSLIPRIDSKQLPAFGLIMLLLVAIPLTKFALDRNTYERSKAAGNYACTYLSQWGSQGNFNSQFNYPQGITTDTSGNVFVTDTSSHRIQKFDGLGNYLMQWGSNGSGNGQFYYPYGIVTDGSGNVYIADGDGSHTGRVQKFTNDGVYLATIGSLGSTDGKFMKPFGLARDSSGNIYVTDTFLDRIQKFDSNGNFLTKWSPTTPSGSYTRTAGISVSGDKVLVSNPNNNAVEVFDTNGTFLYKFGSQGSSPGQLSHPLAISSDVNGKIFVSESYNNRVQIFDVTGASQYLWGSSGNGNGQFSGPQGIATGGLGLVYIADTNNNRIQKFLCTVSATPTPTINPTATPTPTPPLWIQVVAPNGGETLYTNQTYRIKWNNDPKIDKVNLGYKACDSCLDWLTDGLPIQNNGYFDWNVSVHPSYATNQFRIWIIGYQTGTGSVTDTSDNTFTVLTGAIVTPTPTPIPQNSPVVTTTALTQGKFKKPYSGAISGYDADLIDNLSMSFSGLPAGLLKGPCTQTKSDKVYLTCQINGTANQKGTFTVTVNLGDGRGGISSKNLSLIVR